MFILIAAYIRGIDIKNNPAVEKHIKYQNELSNFLTHNNSSKHLIFVQYDPQVDPNVEYVYNSATLDHQQIIWARWTEKFDASPLLRHYFDRKIWMLWVTPNQIPELRQFKWENSVGN